MEKSGINDIDLSVNFQDLIVDKSAEVLKIAEVDKENAVVRVSRSKNKLFN